MAAQKKSVSVKMNPDAHEALAAFRDSHGWSVNETINQAIGLLLAIKEIDAEDRLTAQSITPTPTRQAGRIMFHCRDGESKRELGISFMNGLKNDPSTVPAREGLGKTFK